MSGKFKSMIQMSSALWLVSGAGAGMFLSMLFSFSIALGIVFGAAAGLIIGAVVFSFLHKK